MNKATAASSSKAKTVSKTPRASKKEVPVSGIIPIILESPNKIRKIQSFLPGGQYIVMASMGHFRELSNGGNTGIGVEMTDDSLDVLFQDDAKKKGVITSLRSKCKGATRIYLATDPDREGEAIAWHLTELLGPKRDYYRIRFQSITRPEVLRALENPQRLDMNLVLAQRTRAIMDKWIGWRVSPLCWRNVGRDAKSAGRVQSPALRLIVEREREIRTFQPKEYFTISAPFQNRIETVCVNPKTKRSIRKEDTIVIETALTSFKEQTTSPTFDTEEAALAAIDWIRTNIATWSMSITERESEHWSPPPYTTLTILQDAYHYLRYSPEYTMTLLQKMYENGWITYHRTDSIVLSAEGVFGARAVIHERYPELETPAPRGFQNRGTNTQEAHEPIRPTHYNIVNLLSDLEEGEKGVEDEKLPQMAKVYSIIYLRTIASQCRPSINTVVRIEYKNADDKVDSGVVFSYTESTLKTPGWKALYSDTHLNLFTKRSDDGEEATSKRVSEPVQALLTAQYQGCDLSEFGLETHTTRPPPYFTPSTIIRELERLGIGRPSTMSSILPKLTANAYVQETGGRLHPTHLGERLIDFLLQGYSTHFLDYKYTQGMETVLDTIAEGKEDWNSAFRRFVADFTSAE